MLDIKFIRENTEALKNTIKLKKIDLDLDALIELDLLRRDLMTKTEDIARQRKLAAQNRDIELGKSLKDQFDIFAKELDIIEIKFRDLMVKVPNIQSSDTPVGKDDSENVEVFVSGDIPKFDFTPKDHIELGKSLDILDLDRGAKVGGYRAYYLKNEGAILVMALMMYAVRKLTSHGFTPMIPPTMIKDFALFGSGYFKGTEYDPEIDEIYQVATSDKEATGEKSSERKFLVGTAEPSLLAYYSNETLDLDKLPMKIVGYSQCYRSEIGSYGKDTKGMYRVHEFMKVEQVVLAPADMDLAEELQEQMVALSKGILSDLGLTFRQLAICTGDLGAGKYKQYDLEAWLPGLKRWGETGSASNFLDWQSRRLGVKYKTESGESKFAFMLNNTALASPRVFIAILETFQQADGSVIIPDTLVPFTGFSKILPK